MNERSRSDWSALEPTAIPTKNDVPQLERWLESLPAGARILDVGCGAGTVAAPLIARRFDVVGIDINARAIEHCRRALPDARFYERDIAAVSGFQLDGPQFDAIVCQLVASVVGDAADREQLFRNVRGVLARGGTLFASFSGLSDDVNPEYAKLYASDQPDTGTYGTYWSRDATGHALYCTHHFGEEEIESLLASAGFINVAVESVLETSSRRPDQRARFYYASCRRG